MTPLDMEFVGAITVLFGLLVGGGKWMFNRLVAELTVCQEKLAATQKAAEDQLSAYRLKEQEELKAWRATQSVAGKDSA